MIFMKPIPSILQLNILLQRLRKLISGQELFLKLLMVLVILIQLFIQLRDNFCMFFVHISNTYTQIQLLQMNTFWNIYLLCYPSLVIIPNIYLIQICQRQPKLIIPQINPILQFHMKQKNQQNPTISSLEQNNQKLISKKSTSAHGPSILSNNFFEVTINSQKLSDLFSNLNEIIRDQNKKIQKASKDLLSVISSLQNKVECQSKKSGLLFSKLDLKIAQNMNIQQIYIADAHKKSQQRCQQLGHKIDILNSKIGKVQDTAKDDLKNGLLNLKKQIIGDFFLSEESKQVIQQENNIQELPAVNFTSLRTNFQSQIEKLRLSLKQVFDEFYQMKQNQKKKKHTQDYLELAQKKQMLQTNISLGMKNEQKIVYPSNRKGPLTKQKENQRELIEGNGKLPTKFTRHMSFNRFSGVEEDMVNQLGNKIFSIENALNEHQQNLADIKNKQIIIDEKSLILSRKFEKISVQMAEIKNILRRMDGQKTDDKIIEELRNYIKWGVKDLEEKVNKKCTEEDLIRERNRIHQKIAILHGNIIEKADKDQIQKAIFFLQGKIKEIIFLIAAQQSQQREGAILKVATKCLSCDKQVQRHLQSQSKCKRQLNKISQGQYIKSMTHRVRQKYKKQASKTIGNQTFDD